MYVKDSHTSFFDMDNIGRHSCHFPSFFAEASPNQNCGRIACRRGWRVDLSATSVFYKVSLPAHTIDIPLTYLTYLTSIDIHWPFVTQKIPQDAVGNLETSGRKTSWKPSAGLPGAWGNLCRSFGTPFTFAVDLVYCIWIDFSIGTGRPHFCALTTKSSELLKMWKMFGAWGVDSRV